MSDLTVATRNPKFDSLMQSLTTETNRFQQALLDKRRFLSQLGNTGSISREDRRTFMDHLKVESKIYHGIRGLQEEVLRILSRESRK